MSDNTQYICDSQPFCLCVGKINEWDECDCTGNIRGCNHEICEACGAPLILIDFETGEQGPHEKTVYNSRPILPNLHG